MGGLGYRGFMAPRYDPSFNIRFSFCFPRSLVFIADRSSVLMVWQIAPLKYRHVGGAAGAFGEWLFSFITVFAGGIALENIGWKIWIWMVLSCWVAMPFVWFMCPETTGKSLEEIDLLFAKERIRDAILEGRMEYGDEGSGEEKSDRRVCVEKV